MFWPLVSTAGFLLAVVLVIALGRAGTARWERQRAAEEDRVRRRRARLARAAGRSPGPEGDGQR
jgi:hypothetical protein